MLVLGVPVIVVRELVNVRVRLTTVDVHVGNGSCRVSHLFHYRPKRNLMLEIVLYIF